VKLGSEDPVEGLSSVFVKQGNEVDPGIRTRGDFMKLWWLRVGRDNPNPSKPSESKTQKT